MRPAGTTSDLRKIIVALISVRFKISVAAFQKLLYMAAAPGRGIALQDDRWKSIFTAAKQPHE